MAFGRTSTRDDRSAGTIPWRPNEQTSRLTASLAVRLQRVYPRPFNFFLDKRGDPPDFINETRFYRIPPETPYKRIQVLEGRNPQQAIFFFPDHSTRKKARLGENKSTSWSLGPWISPFLFFFPFLLISTFIPHSVSLGVQVDHLFLAPKTSLATRSSTLAHILSSSFPSRETCKVLHH